MSLENTLPSRIILKLAIVVYNVAVFCYSVAQRRGEVKVKRRSRAKEAKGKNDHPMSYY